MADGTYLGPDYLTRSHFLSEAESPTQMQMPQTAGFANPEQLMGMLQNPQMQQMLQRYGISFNPQQIQQSPYFGNQFMQAHPHLGGMFSGMLANAAMTPGPTDASGNPVASGFGAGLSRMAQGMAGGPEMQRQYQVRQLLAPFSALATTMPTVDEARKQQLLQAMMGDIMGRRQLSQQAFSQKEEYDRAMEDLKRQANDLKMQQGQEQAQNTLARIQATRPEVFSGTPYYMMYNPGQAPNTPYPMTPGMGPTMLPQYNQPQGGGWQLQTIPQYQQPFGGSSNLINPKAGQLTPKPTKGSTAGQPTRKQFADIEGKKSQQYAQLEQQYKPFFLAKQGFGPFAGQTGKDWKDTQQQLRQALEQSKRQIDQSYQQQRSLMGAPVPPANFQNEPGFMANPLLNPGGVGQQMAPQNPPQGGYQQGAPLIFGNQAYDENGNPIQYPQQPTY